MTAHRPRSAAIALMVFAALTVAGPLSADAQPASFAAENEAAMARMHAAMAIQPTGDVDRDFVAMMIPHHQGAIDMAVAVLRHSRNERLRRLAQEIIIEQREEITAMRLAIGDPLPPEGPMPTLSESAPVTVPASATGQSHPTHKSH